MKKRIQIDSAILSFIVILTGLLYLFPNLYVKNLFWDKFCNFLGLIIVLKGVYLRMAARGFKKEFSQKSQELVTEGPYTLTRNPMYLGSFLMGCGFVLIVWPVWFLPIFAILFYIRFNKQIVKEEGFLLKNFGDSYAKYCKRVPRLFPDMRKAWEINVEKTFPWDTCWNTKEKRGLLWWPVLAVFLESLQKKIVFGVVDLKGTLVVFVVAMIVFFLGLLVRYKVRSYA